MRRRRGACALPGLAAMLLAVLVLSPAAARAADIIRVGFVPVSANLPLWCGMEMGTFTAEAVEIQTSVIGRGSRILEAMVGGSLDMGHVATLTVIQAAARGLDVVLVGPAGSVRTGPPSSGALVVRKSAGITSVTQLRGKTIAVNQLGSFNYLVPLEHLARAGVGRDEVTWQELDFPHMVAALEQGRVDAANLTEPYLTMLREAGGATHLATQEQVLPGASISGYAVLRSWYDARRPLMERFHRALTRGIEACNRDPQRMREILARSTKLPVETARRMTLATFRPLFGDGEIGLLMETARRHGLIERSWPAERLVVPTARER